MAVLATCMLGAVAVVEWAAVGAVEWVGAVAAEWVVAVAAVWAVAAAEWVAVAVAAEWAVAAVEWVVAVAVEWVAVAVEWAAVAAEWAVAVAVEWAAVAAEWVGRWRRRYGRRWRRNGWRAAAEWVAAVADMSDIHAKHDIVLLGHLDNGLGFYRFSYNGSDKAYVGVMAQEVQTIMPEAVARGSDGYLRVNYELLGLHMQTWEEWMASGERIPATATSSRH